MLHFKFISKFLYVKMELVKENSMNILGYKLNSL